MLKAEESYITNRKHLALAKIKYIFHGAIIVFLKYFFDIDQNYAKCNTYANAARSPVFTIDRFNFIWENIWLTCLQNIRIVSVYFSGNVFNNWFHFYAAIFFFSIGLMDNFNKLNSSCNMSMFFPAFKYFKRNHVWRIWTLRFYVKNRKISCVIRCT